MNKYLLFTFMCFLSSCHSHLPLRCRECIAACVAFLFLSFYQRFKYHLFTARVAPLLPTLFSLSSILGNWNNQAAGSRKSGCLGGRSWARECFKHPYCQCTFCEKRWNVFRPVWEQKEGSGCLLVIQGRCGRIFTPAGACAYRHTSDDRWRIRWTKWEREALLVGNIRHAFWCRLKKKQWRCAWGP